MLVRTDPSHHRIAYLSIPRDLYVPVHGVGEAKINAAYQAGGAPLAIRTIREYTGLKINHVVVVDFSKFKDLIDAEGGIDVNVPAADPLEQIRLPVQRGEVPDLGRLALREGQAAHERPARAHLLAHPREPAQPARERLHARGAPAGRDAGGDLEAHLARCDGARCRSRATR